MRSGASRQRLPLRQERSWTAGSRTPERQRHERRYGSLPRRCGTVADHHADRREACTRRQPASRIVVSLGVSLMESQAARAESFKSLHARPRIFAIPNPWDAGSAKMLAALGFEALATTSAGLAFSLGKPDGEGALSRDKTLANARAIAAATPLPVSADLENCFGDAPETCAETIRLAAEAGLVVGSIEDATGRADRP